MDDSININRANNHHPLLDKGTNMDPKRARFESPEESILKDNRLKSTSPDREVLATDKAEEIVGRDRGKDRAEWAPEQILVISGEQSLGENGADLNGQLQPHNSVTTL